MLSPSHKEPSATRDEQSVIARAKAGDNDAFDSLIRSHANRVFGYLVHLLGDRAAAEDAFQEATLRAYKSLHRLREHAPFRPWFFRIAINRAKTQLKKRRQSRELSVPAEASELPMVETSLGIRRLLEQTLARVSRADREILLLRYFEDSSISEISEILGVPGFVAKMRLSRARRRFRQWYQALANAGEPI